MIKKFKAKENDVNRTLFKYLEKMLDNVPISRLEKLFREKDVRINGQKTNEKHYKLQLNDEILVYGLKDVSRETKRSKANINFSIVYEDKNLLIVDKKVNVAIHSEENCLNDQVLTYLDYKKTSSFIPSSIGRIDKKTSGIVVYCKNYQTLTEFSEKQDEFEKVYQFVSDFKSLEKQEVAVRLKKDIKNEKMIANDSYGVKAKTIFWTDGMRNYAQIVTGKKHQIRATLEYLHCPIVGDTKYGGKRARRMFLHSYSITFHNLSDDFKEYNEQTFVCPPHW